MSNSRTSSRAADVHVALDLGSDTLKIAYAFNVDGSEYTGKIVHDSDTMTALPAVALYDSEKGKWFFCEEVSRQKGSYLTVVKIKRLISLLQKVGDSAADKRVCKTNTQYYNSIFHFPKFYFSLESDTAVDDVDFDQLVKKEKTFVAEGFTPKQVCQMYFEHVAAIVHMRLKTLMKPFKCDYELRLSIVYPPHVGNEFIKELERLVLHAFRVQSVRFVLSMTKALSIYASHRNMLHVGESALIFNVGEEKTFVVKTDLSGSDFNKTISIDGVEGHKPAISLGGNDIDKAVGVYLNRVMNDRETMGSPSAGSVGHIYESGLSSKEYLFVQEIKSAKIMFGMYGKDDEIFGNGVPINASKSLRIQMKLTHDEFAECIGLKGNGKGVTANSFALKLCEYVEDELDRSINREVTRVFISGGVVETYGLVKMIKERLKDRVCKEKGNQKIVVTTFESELSKPYNANSDGFEIFEHEDAVYAPAVGCAIAALNNITVKTVTSLTYGTDAYNSKLYPLGALEILLNKHEEIPENGCKAAKEYFATSGDQHASMLLFSLNLSEQEIKQKKFREDVEYYDNGMISLVKLIYKRKNANYARKLEKIIGFKQRNEDKDALITFHHHGKRVALKNIYSGTTANDVFAMLTAFNGGNVADDKKFWFGAGIQIDKLGVASPYVYNATRRNEGKRVEIVELKDKPNSVEGDAEEIYGTSRTVSATEIEVSCKPFRVAIDNGD